MAHDKKSSIRAVYNHAQHLEERRKIMQVWADFLDLLRDKGEVVDFQTARQQIERSLERKRSESLQNADKKALIEALLTQGLTADELQGYIAKH
ncbi:hypothetical protein ACTXJ5_04670 [Psychrobacter alimentarius]|uniref:hypothetical protein n=1 Tax=Psychrobacter alimentarius TaxID=261164 RepID=UPI003FD18BFA